LIDGQEAFEGDEDVADVGEGSGRAGAKGEIVPNAHWDIKPGCVLFSFSYFVSC
jgi:hypothetical protein